MKDKTNFFWGDKHEKAFLKLKERPKENSGIYKPDFTKPFKLESDTYNNTGIAGIISQDYKGNDVPIAFGSRT